MFNRHKIKRKWKRRQKKKSRRFLYDESNAKDFAWKNRKKNPYRNETTPFFKKIKVQISIIFICTSGGARWCGSRGGARAATAGRRRRFGGAARAVAARRPQQRVGRLLSFGAQVPLWQTPLFGR